ncbi:Protein CBG24074 [Caenorhabditis briggsae]|uniref:Protein CBG24074 n=1 Tax=Caenorhabditis briggsae TaxID=6238 RepID=A8WJX4_CAEBR|nr:Protein CBG24074 [Caenorhabditis briggsae]CAP20767.2 Protein CBG24074 [Caenorhabditis briggsae]
MKHLKPVQVAEISSSDDSWRMDLMNETAKVGSLYPRPYSDPLALQAILEGNEVHHNKENEGMKLRKAIMAGVDSTRKRRSAQKDQDQNKPNKVQKIGQKSSKLETPTPEKKLGSLYPKPYADPLELRSSQLSQSGRHQLIPAIRTFLPIDDLPACSSFRNRNPLSTAHA